MSSLRIVNPLATSTRESLSVLCLWVLSIVRLLNIVCVKRSDVFSLRAEEKDLSTAALVGGYTRKKFSYGYSFSYHTLFGFRKLLYLS